MKGSSQRLALVVAVVSLIWLLLGIWRPLIVYDEGIALVGATRILDGEIPYRDFYAIYAPGQYYLTAMALELFGGSVISHRLSSVLVRTLIACLAFAWVRRFDAPGAAWASWALVLLWLGRYEFFGIASFPALASGLLAVLAASRARDRGGAASWWALSGAATGLVFLFRQDFGVYALLAQGALWVLTAWRGGTEDRRAMGRAVLAYGGGLAALGAIPAVYFLLQVGPGTLFHDLFRWPYELTSRYRNLPTAGLFALRLSDLPERAPILVSLLLYAVFPILLVPHLARGTLARCWVDAAHLWLFGVALLNQGLRRTDPIHFSPTVLVALLLAVPILQSTLGAPRLPPSRRRALALAVLLPALLLAYQPLWVMLRVSLPGLTTALGRDHGIPAAGALPLPPDQAAALRFVRASTTADEPLFVGTARHDLVVWNDIAFYFLAERRPATRYYKYDPGFTESAAIQERMVAEIEANSTRVVVLFRGSEHRIEGEREGSHLLDSYLRANFLPARRFGVYEVRLRDLGPGGE